MSAKGWAVGAIAALVVIGSCTGPDEPEVASSPVAASPPAYAAPVVVPSTTSPAAPAGVAVVEVIDGDTFEIAGGERVQVLGIDSCEPETYGGRQATTSAQSRLSGATVVLDREPGVDRDGQDRLLRYVTVVTSYGYSSDFGEDMVIASHTGLETDDGTSSARLAALEERDSGRDCAEPQYLSPSTEVDIDVDDDGDVNLPDGALTGGYCARKWWC